MLALGYVHTIWGLEMVASHYVINVVYSTWSHTDLSEIWGPDTTVGILGLILRIVRRIDVVVDVSVSVIPFLIVILFEVMMCWVNCKVFANPCCQFNLLIHFAEHQIVFFADHTVTISAVSCEHLEAYDYNQQKNKGGPPSREEQ